MADEQKNIGKAQCLLTTWDNPWSPFTQFYDWFDHDKYRSQGNCCEQLALHIHTFDGMSDDDQLEEYERAVDEIVAANPAVYRKLWANEPIS